MTCTNEPRCSPNRKPSLNRVGQCPVAMRATSVADVGRAAFPRHDVHVGTQQDEIESIDLTRDLVGDIEFGDRCAEGLQCASELRAVVFRVAKAQNAVSRGWNAVLHGAAVVEPDMRQPRARPRGGLVGAKQVLGSARDIANNRRADVAIAEFGADHLVGLALLDIGDRGHDLAGLPSLRRVVADIGPPH